MIPQMIPFLKTSSIMATLPSTRFVFDRKHTATKETKGLVQLEILYKGKRKFVGTGIKLYIDQWRDKSHVVNTTEREQLNTRLDVIKSTVDNYINNVYANGKVFDFDTFSKWLAHSQKQEQPFIEWLEDRIVRRTDTTASTKRTQLKLVKVLTDWGGITTFSDLNSSGINLFDDYLQAKGIKQTTVWSYHKTLKTYINDAMRHDLITDNPYRTFKSNKGKSEWGRFLSLEEVAKIENATLPSGSLQRVRDLFLFQCYTGISYADLFTTNYKQYNVVDGIRLLNALRHKTHAPFTTILSDKAMAILQRYNYTFCPITNSQYNLRLKLVATACGINKPIASHWGRRTCGMVMLNEGIPIEVVAKVLGHANINTTQECYAKVLDYTIAQAFKKK